MNKIEYAERAAVYREAIDKYGVGAQLTVAIEEMAELAKELCKYNRGADNIDHIAEEIADVTIMLEQLRVIFNCNDAVCEQMDAKIERLRGRLNNDTK